jgi:hypothetical protein
MYKQPAPNNTVLEPGGHRSDRRISPRYSAVKNRACLSWRVEAENCESTARLINISSSGALVLAEKRPARGRAVWLRLEVPVATEWVEATIVRIVKVPGVLWFRKTAYLVRICFKEPCPYHLFKLATHGHQLDAVTPETTLPEHDNRYWR